MFWFLAHIWVEKDNPTLSFWWLFNRIQAKLVIRYQLSVIGYQLLLLLQQNCSTCFYLLLSVLLLLFSIFLLLLLSLLLTTIIQLLLIMILLVIWCHLMVIWQKKNYLLGTLLSQIIYKPIHYGIWIMQFYWPCHAKGAIAAAQWINLKENLQFWISDPLSTTVCV